MDPPFMLPPIFPFGLLPPPSVFQVELARLFARFPGAGLAGSSVGMHTNGHYSGGSRGHFSPPYHHQNQYPNHREHYFHGPHRIEQFMQMNKPEPRHPQLMKTTLCDFYMQGRECKFGRNCWFAHGHHELRHSSDNHPNSVSNGPRPSGRPLQPPSPQSASAADEAHTKITNSPLFCPAKAAPASPPPEKRNSYEPHEDDLKLAIQILMDTRKTNLERGGSDKSVADCRSGFLRDEDDRFAKRTTTRASKAKIRVSECSDAFGSGTSDESDSGEADSAYMVTRSVGRSRSPSEPLETFALAKFPSEPCPMFLHHNYCIMGDDCFYAHTL